MLISENINELIEEVSRSYHLKAAKGVAVKRLKNLVSNPSIRNLKRVGSIASLGAKHAYQGSMQLKSALKDTKIPFKEFTSNVTKRSVDDAKDDIKSVGSGIVDRVKSGMKSFKDAKDDKASAFIHGAISKKPSVRGTVAATRIGLMSKGGILGRSAAIGGTIAHNSVKELMHRANVTGEDINKRIDSDRNSEIKAKNPNYKFAESKEIRDAKEKQDQHDKKVAEVIDRTKEVVSKVKKLVDSSKAKKVEPSKPTISPEDQSKIVANDQAINAHKTNLARSKTATDRQKITRELSDNIDLKHLTSNHKDYLRQVGVLESLT